MVTLVLLLSLAVLFTEIGLALHYSGKHAAREHQGRWQRFLKRGGGRTCFFSRADGDRRAGRTFHID